MRVIFIIISLFFTTVSFAQKVQFKKSKVLIDKIETFDFNRSLLSNDFSLYKLNSKDEIIYISHFNNETPRYHDDDYKKIVFIKQNIIVESSRLRSKTLKQLIRLLLEEEILDKDGNINPEKLQSFVTKYNENITNRTMRF